MELFNIERKRAATINLVALILLSLPCALGYNVLSSFEPMGAGSSVLDLEDFIVSNLLLPLGSLVYLLFCTWKFGWGMESYRQEANEGKGPKVPAWAENYLKFVLPVLIVLVFLQGVL